MSLETTWCASSFSLVQMQPYLYQNGGVGGGGGGGGEHAELADVKDVWGEKWKDDKSERWTGIGGESLLRRTTRETHFVLGGLQLFISEYKHQHGGGSGVRTGSLHSKWLGPFKIKVVLIHVWVVLVIFRIPWTFWGVGRHLFIMSKRRSSPVLDRLTVQETVLNAPPQVTISCTVRPELCPAQW